MKAMDHILEEYYFAYNPKQEEKTQELVKYSQVQSNFNPQLRELFPQQTLHKYFASYLGFTKTLRGL